MLTYFHFLIQCLGINSEFSHCILTLFHLSCDFAIQSCLGDLGTVSGRFKDVLDFGFSQLTASAVKPRIKPVIDSFISTNHNLTEASTFNHRISLRRKLVISLYFFIYFLRHRSRLGD